MSEWVRSCSGHGNLRRLERKVVYIKGFKKTNMFIIKPTATQSKKKNMAKTEHDTFKGRLPDFLFRMPHRRVFNHDPAF